MYHYVGPADVASSAGTGPGRPLTAASSLPATPVPVREMLTYVVSPAGVLLIAPRNSEHVACAGGGPVLAAGEISFTLDGEGLRVGEVTNQSTGYCPEPSCWPAVAAALDSAGIRHDGGFTTDVIFRRCPDCDAVNLVKEAVFVCDLCGAGLPAIWNVAR